MKIIALMLSLLCSVAGFSSHGSEGLALKVAGSVYLAAFMIIMSVERNRR